MIYISYFYFAYHGVFGKQAASNSMVDLFPPIPLSRNYRNDCRVPSLLLINAPDPIGGLTTCGSIGMIVNAIYFLNLEMWDE